MTDGLDLRVGEGTHGHLDDKAFAAALFYRFAPIVEDLKADDGRKVFCEHQVTGVKLAAEAGKDEGTEPLSRAVDGDDEDMLVGIGAGLVRVGAETVVGVVEHRFVELVHLLNVGGRHRSVYEDLRHYRAVVLADPGIAEYPPLSVYHVDVCG